jgi:hypothetical protein
VASNHQILGKRFGYHVYVTLMFPLNVGSMRTPSTHVTFSSTELLQIFVFSAFVYVMNDSIIYLVTNQQRHRYTYLKPESCCPAIITFNYGHTGLESYDFAFV